jgi:hypothetical protein
VYLEIECKTMITQVIHEEETAMGGNFQGLNFTTQ